MSRRSLWKEVPLLPPPLSFGIGRCRRRLPPSTHAPAAAPAGPSLGGLTQLTGKLSFLKMGLPRAVCLYVCVSCVCVSSAVSQLWSLQAQKPTDPLGSWGEQNCCVFPLHVIRSEVIHRSKNDFSVTERAAVLVDGLRGGHGCGAYELAPTC